MTPAHFRVRLIAKPCTEPTSLEAGDEGTVMEYDANEDRMSVRWDNGSRIGVSGQDVVVLPRGDYALL